MKDSLRLYLFMLSCVFWNNTRDLTHKISSIWSDGEKVFTGGASGEICYWVECKVYLVTSCLPASRCLYLCGGSSPDPIFLGCKSLLVSFHQDLKIRTWDRQDGRCLNSEKVTDCGQVIAIESSGNRILAIVFKEEVLVYDIWTLQKLQVLKSCARIVKVQFYTETKIVLMNESSQLVFWHFSDTLIDPEPYFSLNLGFSYRLFRLDSEKNLLLLMDDCELRVFRVEDLKINQPKGLRIEGKDFESFEVVASRVIVKSFEKVIIYSLEDITLALMENLFEYVPEFQESFLDDKEALLIGSKLWMVRENGVEFQDVLLDSLENVTMNFKIPSNEFSFLNKDERLTYSSILTDTWEFLLGTSSGRVLKCPLSSPCAPTPLHTFDNSPVLCIKIHKSYKIASSLSSLLFIETPEGQSHEISLLSPATDFIQTRCIESSPSETSQFWKNSWKNWEETLLIQSEDKSITLISLNTQTCISHFLSNFSSITEAAINVKSESLLVKSQEVVYVYDIINQNLERTITGVACNESLRKTVSILSQLDYNSSETLPSDEHKVIETNWRGFNINKPVKLSQSLVIQDSINPILVLQDQTDLNNVSHISGILTCWKKDCTSHSALLALLPDMQKTVYNFSFGLRGDGWFSYYTQPSFCSPSRSSFIDTLKAGLMYKLNKLACPELKLQIGVLAFKSLTSQQSSQSIIKDLISTFSNKKKEKILASCKKIIHLRTPTSAVVHKSLQLLGSLRNVQISSEWTRVKVSLAECQACLILPYYSSDIPRELVLMVATSLFAMLRQGQGKIAAVGQVLKHTLPAWKALVLPQTKQVIKELIQALPSSSNHRVYFKVLTTIFISDLKANIQLVTDEIDKVDHLTRKTWLSFLAWLVSHKHCQVAYYSQGLVEVLLKVLSPHNAMVRKLSSEQCSEILHVLVKSLPMVDFSQSKQKIAVGTSEGSVVIYDLKTASFWKCLEGHTGPLAAVMFSATGSSVVSYSAIDLSVRLWKIEVRFYQELFSAKNITACQVVSLPQVKSGVSYYKEFVEGVKFLVKGGLRLVREDLKEYEINLSLV